MTLLELAQRVLLSERTPLTLHEIWNIAEARGYTRSLTPAQNRDSVVKLHTAISLEINANGQRSEFMLIPGAKPKYYLRSVLEKHRTMVERKEQPLFDLNAQPQKKDALANRAASEDNRQRTAVERKEKTSFKVGEQQSSEIIHPNNNDYPRANHHDGNDNNYSNGAGKKLLQVFKYLLELKRLTAPVIREIEFYGERLWWVKDLPVSPKGCHLRDSSEIQNKDAWLEVHKQKIPPYPEPDEVLTGWLAEKGRDATKQPSYFITLNLLTPEETAELSTLPNQIDEIEKLIPKASHEEAGRLKKELEQKYALWEKLEKKREINFSASPERVREWGRWLPKWKAWSEDALPRMQIQKLYSDLFAVYQRFQKESEDLEMVWGHALLCWKSSTYSIKRPLLGTKVELLFDAERGIFSLLPVEGVTRMETDMLSKIDLPNLPLLSEIENSISSEIDPWQNDQIEGILKRYLHALDERGEVRLQEHDSKNVKSLMHPIVIDQPVIFLRKGLGRLWEKDLKEIITALEQGYPVPKTLESLVTEGQPEADAETLEEWQSVAEDILFPKASSEEQKEILRRLAKNFGVVVQGPPGTGKSHTIVNLLCHLLAHGKRVLVTSQAERALRVIGAMIPENIKPLCVSVMGGDSRSADELEHAITKISENLATIDEFAMEKEVQKINKILRECRKSIAELRLKMKELAQKEHQVFNIGENQFTTLEVSKWLSENNDEHGWLPDNIASDTPPLSDESIARMFSLQGLILLSDANAIKQRRLSLDTLPSAMEIEQDFNLMKQLSATLSGFSDKVTQWKSTAQELTLNRPILRELPSVEKIKDHFQSLTSIEGKLGVFYALPEAWQSLELDIDVLPSLEILAKESRLLISALNKPWLKTAITELLAGGMRRTQWEVFHIDSQEKVSDIIELENQLMEHKISFEHMSSLSAVELQNHLTIYKDNFLNAGSFQKCINSITKKRSKQIVRAISIDGHPICSQADIELIIRYVDYHDRLQKIMQKWSRILGAVGAELPAMDDARLSTWFTACLDELQKIIVWTTEVKDRASSLRQVAIDDQVWIQVQFWDNVEKLIDGIKAKLKLKKLKEQYNDLEKQFQTQSKSVGRQQMLSCPNCFRKNHIDIDSLIPFIQLRCSFCEKDLEPTLAHPVWLDLYDAFQKKDIEKWKEAVTKIEDLDLKSDTYQVLFEEKKDCDQRLVELQSKHETIIAKLHDELKNPSTHETTRKLIDSLSQKNIEILKEAINEITRLKDLEPSTRELEELLSKLEKVAPIWASDIRSMEGTGKPFQPPKDWHLAWTWKQADDWITKIQRELRPEEIQEKIDYEMKREANIVEELVAKSTWYRQKLRVSNAQRKSLAAWLAINRKIGKGTGKYVPYWRLQAKKEMEICQGAVPVWIMPLFRVVENLKVVEEEQFDVVIVDESSQSDLFALTALFRAKKAVIVGDDKQISPSAVGIDQSEVIKLTERFLQGIPNKALFEPRVSLYDTAFRIFPIKLMLKEHFRSVPEIIQFSNHHFYRGEIVPLRLPFDWEKFEPPVTAVHVPNGWISDSTAKINEPEANALVDKIVELCKDPNYEEKTMGVISLLGEDQAQLIDKLIREKLDDQEIVRRRLISGDAYSFQGDQRHIMFLSLVAAPNGNHAPLVRQDDSQRFNVAASRARDQMWLFYSITPSNLHPQCMRSYLLRYCLNPFIPQPPTEEIESLFESPFEKDVYQKITSRGFNVRPQVRVGQYRIDLVVYGMKGERLAIECDGDRWHGPEKWEEDQIREDALRRVGWTFWRLRGSIFYRNPGVAMESLWKQLDEMGIYPVTDISTSSN